MLLSGAESLATEMVQVILALNRTMAALTVKDSDTFVAALFKFISNMTLSLSNTVILV